VGGAVRVIDASTLYFYGWTIPLRAVMAASSTPFMISSDLMSLCPAQ